MNINYTNGIILRVQLALSRSIRLRVLYGIKRYLICCEKYVEYIIAASNLRSISVRSH